MTIKLPKRQVKGTRNEAGKKPFRRRLPDFVGKYESDLQSDEVKDFVKQAFTRDRR